VRNPTPLIKYSKFGFYSKIQEKKFLKFSKKLKKRELGNEKLKNQKCELFSTPFQKNWIPF